MGELEEYYGKYNEEKRLLRPYGRVEYLTTMHYIHETIANRQGLKILDVGAATGRYTIPLAEEGHELTAVELVKYNLGILKQKAERACLTNVKAMQGNALNLKKIASDAYDIVLFLGPMYHLFSEDEKVQALCEAKRVVKPGGRIFTAYVMNEFGVITHAFKDGFVKDAIRNGKLDADFHIRNTIEDLFSFDRLEDTERYFQAAGLRREKIISADGATNYMRETVTEMDAETFNLFMKYQLSTCERMDLMGAANHTVDILYKDE